jgi:hypothetical protein
MNIHCTVYPRDIIRQGYGAGVRNSNREADPLMRPNPEALALQYREWILGWVYFDKMHFVTKVSLYFWNLRKFLLFWCMTRLGSGNFFSPYYLPKRSWPFLKPTKITVYLFQAYSQFFGGKFRQHKNFRETIFRTFLLIFT